MLHKRQQLPLERKQPLTQRTLGQVRTCKGRRKRVQLTLLSYSPIPADINPHILGELLTEPTCARVG